MWQFIIIIKIRLRDELCCWWQGKMVRTALENSMAVPQKVNQRITI